MMSFQRQWWLLLLLLFSYGVERRGLDVADRSGFFNTLTPQYHPTANANGRSRVVGVPVYADWNAPFFFIAFRTELY